MTATVNNSLSSGHGCWVPSRQLIDAHQKGPAFKESPRQTTACRCTCWLGLTKPENLFMQDHWHAIYTSPTCFPRCAGSCAGHAGDVLDGKWYIVGGGNNTSACTELLRLDLAGLGGTPLVDTPSLRWDSLVETDLSAPTATEGLSLSSLPHLGLILAFGGYNGKYHGGVQVYRPGLRMYKILPAH